MQKNEENLMKLFGMKDPLSKLLDNFEQDKDSNTLVKTILVAIFDSMVYVLLFAILIITLPMLLPAIILRLLLTPALLLSIVLENLTHSLSGTQTKKKVSGEYIHNGTLTRSGVGTRHSHKE